MILRSVTSGDRAGIAAEAAAMLSGGGLVILPTDTVYGVAALPGNHAALRRLRGLKGRSRDKPIALLAADVAAITEAGARLSGAAWNLADSFWPGALTLVLKCAEREEGFRVPDNELARLIIAACGGLLRVSSANLAGEPPALTALEALESIGREVDMVIDGGAVAGEQASTVVRDNDGDLQILRAGAIPAKAIFTVAERR